MSARQETFFAIDFDRCISNTDALFDVFYAVVDDHEELNREQLIKARKAIEDNGGSFDQITALKEHLSETSLLAFIDEFIQRSRTQDLLNPGSRELMGALDANSVAYGIITYGNSDWQDIKIRASGISGISVLITPHGRKAEIVNSWQKDDGLFTIPHTLAPTDGELRTETVVLIDDKALAFTHLSSHARGYWVKSSTASLLPSQIGDVPDNVSEVFSMADIIKLEAL